MIVKKFLVASSYIVSISGAGAVCWYLVQPKTIGEAISKIDTLSTTQEHFVDTWRLFKNDSNFMNYAISANRNLNLTSSSVDTDAAEILRDYCKEILEFPLADPRVNDLMPKALSWCTVPKQKAKAQVVIGDSASWSEMVESIEDKGMKPDGKTFLSVVDYSNYKSGLRRKTFYCWNKETKNWDIKKEGAFCN